jgi:DNA polymerase III delta prime subunit
MILRELFYLNPETQSVSNDFRFDAARDIEELHRSDTRKTRLTLGQINELRRSSEAHILEQEEELEFVHQMYGVAPAAPPA